MSLITYFDGLRTVRWYYLIVKKEGFGHNDDENDLFCPQADAEWKRIQQNTFTRWANEHLKTVDKVIEDLSKDLSDGLKLIALIEVLSGKKMPRHNKKPNFRYVYAIFAIHSMEI